MAWSAPTFTPAVTWQDDPATATPLNAADLNAMTTGGATYAAAVGTSVAAWATAAFDAIGAASAEATRAEGVEATLAPIASPTFTGSPRAQTQAANDNSTQLATTAYADRVGGGGLSGSTTGGGAETASAGRTSTIAAPVLRDFCSVKDVGYAAKGGGKAFATGGVAIASNVAFNDTTNSPFTSAMTGMTLILPGGGTSGRCFSTTVTYVSATHLTCAAAPVTSISGAYQLVWDDTTAIQAAESNATGVLWYPPDTYGWSSITPGVRITRYAYGCTFWQLPGQLNAMIFDNSSGAQRSGFRWFGGDFHGEGITVANNTNQLHAIWLAHYDNIVIRDASADGFADGGFICWGCTNVWYLGLRVTNVSTSNLNRNALNFYTGSSATAMGPIYVHDCYTGGTIPTAALAFNCTGGITWQGAIITHNELTCQGFGCVVTEINSYSGTDSVLQRAAIASNVLTNNSTGAVGSCIQLLDDGGSPYADAYKISDYLIQTNFGTCSVNYGAGATGAAVILGVSRCLVADNIFVETGTRGQCVYSSAPSAGLTSQRNRFDGNYFHQSNTVPTNSVCHIQNATQWSFMNNTISSDATSTSATGDGLRVEATCANYQVQGNFVINAPQNGMNFLALDNGSVSGNRIYNCNAADSSGSNTIGIRIQGNGSGLPSIIDANKIVDDGTRSGGKWMTLAVTSESSSGTLPHLIGNTMWGAKNGVINGGTPNFTVIRGNVTDYPGFPAATANPAPPASTVAFAAAANDRYVSWWGGTVTVAAHTRNAVTTNCNPAGGTAFLRAHDDTFAWTYTVAPTLQVTPA